MAKDIGRPARKVLAASPVISVFLQQTDSSVSPEQVTAQRLEEEVASLREMITKAVGFSAELKERDEVITRWLKISPRDAVHMIQRYNTGFVLADMLKLLRDPMGIDGESTLQCKWNNHGSDAAREYPLHNSITSVYQRQAQWNDHIRRANSRKNMIVLPLKKHFNWFGQQRILDINYLDVFEPKGFVSAEYSVNADGKTHFSRDISFYPSSEEAIIKAIEAIQGKNIDDVQSILSIVGTKRH